MAYEDEDTQQERTEGYKSSKGSRIVDKYEYDNSQAAWLEETRNQLTIWFADENHYGQSDKDMINSTMQWMQLSKDFFQKYGTQESYLSVFEFAIEQLEMNREVENAKEQFEYVKPLFQRRFKELNLTMTQIPNRGPFRQGNLQ